VNETSSTTAALRNQERALVLPKFDEKVAYTQCRLVVSRILDAGWRESQS
jgi:hypothetical protein